MHADELDIDIALVGRLLGGQFPDWAGLPIEPVPSAGTDNALYRLGDDMVVRLPRIHWARGQVEKEQEWLPRLAPALPLAIPVPLGAGLAGQVAASRKTLLVDDLDRVQLVSPSLRARGIKSIVATPLDPGWIGDLFEVVPVFREELVMVSPRGHPPIHHASDISLSTLIAFALP